MLKIKIGDVFYTNRLGYSNVLPKEKRETIYDHLGYITITITKVNKKTFKTTYSDELLTDIPKNWFTKLTINNCLQKIIKILKDNNTMYFENLKDAYKFLTNEEQLHIQKELEKISEQEGKEYEKNKLSIYLSRIKYVNEK